jgi:pimeloyl-ACP methyl ester carboxylesterase
MFAGLIAEIYAALAYGAVFAFQTGAFLFVAVVAAVIFFQGRLLYMPTAHCDSSELRGNEHNPPGHRSPQEYALPYDDVRVTTADGVGIHGWLIRHDNGNDDDNGRGVPTVLFFHGNAGNIGFRIDNARALHAVCQCNVLLVDYRAFGDSDAAAVTQEGLEADATAALAYLQAHTSVDNRLIFVFGRSLGGAVAVQLAAQQPMALAAVVIENTFVSTAAMAALIYDRGVGMLYDGAARRVHGIGDDSDDEDADDDDGGGGGDDSDDDESLNDANMATPDLKRRMGGGYVVLSVLLPFVCLICLFFISRTRFFVYLISLSAVHFRRAVPVLRQRELQLLRRGGIARRHARTNAASPPSPSPTPSTTRFRPVCGPSCTSLSRRRGRRCRRWRR